jgi:Domain of unknown function (DUF4340)
MALTRDKQILIAVVVLAGLGTAVYFQQKKDAKIGVETISSAELPSVAGTEDLDKFEITNGEKGQVVLEKKDDKWWVVKPVNALGNQTNIKQMIDNLKELKLTDLVAANATDDIKKSYELDPTKAVHVIGYKAGDKKVDDYFGKSGGRGEMMMIEGKPNVYSASGYAVYMYNREVKGWRDTEIFKFDDATANQATIENTHGVISFTKANDKWVGTFKGQPIERFDEDKVKALLINFKNLNAEDFGEGKTLADTGLDKPEATVTFTLKDNAGKFVLHVGKVSTGTSRFAMKDGSEQLYVIGAMPSEFATTDIPKFQKPLDGGAAKASDAAAATPPPRPPHLPPGHPMVPH